LALLFAKRKKEKEKKEEKKRERQTSDSEKPIQLTRDPFEIGRLPLH
jgi:hypothetical protein